MTDSVIVGKHNNIMVVCINRAEVHNAIHPEASLAIDNAMTEAQNDADVGAVILTGAGERTFCAGMDLKFAASHGVEHVMIPGRGFCGITERFDFTKPLICAASGSAYAGGFELLLACDIVIASDEARFALPEIKRGLFAGSGGIARLAQNIPRASALGLILSGEAITSQRAYELGLVTQLAKPGEVLEKAKVFAATILGNAPQSVVESKKLFNRAVHQDLATGFQLSKATGAAMMATQDRLEGVKAFAEKRQADWKNQ